MSCLKVGDRNSKHYKKTSKEACKNIEETIGEHGISQFDQNKRKAISISRAYIHRKGVHITGYKGNVEMP